MFFLRWLPPISRKLAAINIQRSRCPVFKLLVLELILWVGRGVRVSDSEKIEKGKKGVGVFLGRHKRPKCRHAQEKTGWGFKSRRRGETSSLSQDSPKTKGKAMLGLQIKKASQDSLLQLNELWHHANLDSSWQLLGNQHWLRRIEISY